MFQIPGYVLNSFPVSELCQLLLANTSFEVLQQDNSLLGLREGDVSRTLLPNFSDNLQKASYSVANKQIVTQRHSKLHFCNFHSYFAHSDPARCGLPSFCLANTHSLASYGSRVCLNVNSKRDIARTVLE